MTHADRVGYAAERTRRVGVGVILLSFAHLSSVAHAQGFGDDMHGCADDRPCFNGSYQDGNTVIFSFTGVTGWDFYNVRYALPSGEIKQVENRSGKFTFREVKPNRVYKLSVQGCNKPLLSKSTCSDWVDESVTTAPPKPSVPSPPKAIPGQTSPCPACLVPAIVAAAMRIND